MDSKDVLHAVNRDEKTDFPYFVFDVKGEETFPKNPGFKVMHWHEELQFIFVNQGTIKVSTLNKTIPIKAKEGIFINQNTIHLVDQVEKSHYKSFLFPSYFLTFYPTSPVHTLVKTMTASKEIPFLTFSREIQWQKDILDHLEKLSQLENDGSEITVYKILHLLSTIGLLLFDNVPIPVQKKEDVQEKRMRLMLAFIEEHYGEGITLKDIAESASLSKSECTRCFHHCLNTTPYNYLLEFRLFKAASFLKNSDIPIGRIATMVGFEQFSHFGRCFKEKTGYTPREYRKKQDIISTPINFEIN